MSGDDWSRAVQRLCPHFDLSSDVAGTLGKLVRASLKNVLKDARVCARHSKSSRIEMDDVNGALRMQGFESLYGQKRLLSRELHWAAGAKNLYFAQDNLHPTDQGEGVELSPPPAYPAVHQHWLAIDGVQPEVPENRPVDQKSKKRQNENAAQDAHARKKTKGQARSVMGGIVDGAVKLRLPVVHVLSQEQQTYFSRIQGPIEGSADGEDTENGGAVLESLKEDAALQPLVPYLVRYASNQVKQNLHNTGLLHRIIVLIRSLVQNPHLDLERYGHQILPLIMSCLLASDIGDSTSRDHLSVRSEAAVVLKSAVDVLGNAINDLHVRVSKELLRCLEEGKPLPSQYGAILGIRSLGLSQVPYVAQLLVKHSDRLDELMGDLAATSNKYIELSQCRAMLQDVIDSTQVAKSADGSSLLPSTKEDELPVVDQIQPESVD